MGLKAPNICTLLEQKYIFLWSSRDVILLSGGSGCDSESNIVVILIIIVTVVVKQVFYLENKMVTFGCKHCGPRINSVDPVQVL